jgi:hypothetical protein
MGPYTVADILFAGQTYAELCRRQRITAHKKATGVRTSDIPFLDDLSPSVLLTPEEIRRVTGRTQVRGSACECLKKHLDKFPVVTVILRPGGGDIIGILVTLRAMQAEQAAFQSWKELRQANVDDLKRHPKFDEAIFPYLLPDLTPITGD